MEGKLYIDHRFEAPHVVSKSKMELNGTMHDVESFVALFTSLSDYILAVFQMRKRRISQLLY